MTLIAAFRCHDSVIICADSQETVESGYHKPVEKLRPWDAGEYQVVVAGAGSHGALVDGFTRIFVDEVRRWEADLDASQTMNKINDILLNYHINQLAAFQAPPEEKRIDFVIAVRCKSDGKIFLWETGGPNVVDSIDTYKLVGWEDYLYDHEVNRLYRENATPLRSVMLGVHLFRLAKETSNYIGGPTQIIFMRDTSAWPADYLLSSEQVMSMVAVLGAERVSELEARMDKIGQMMADLLLTCPDTTIKTTEFTDRLVRFMEEVVKQRNEYVNEAFQTIHEHSVSGHGIYPFQISPPEGIALEEDDPITQLLEAMKRQQLESQKLKDQS
jgi:hypothetical protein